MQYPFKTYFIVRDEFGTDINSELPSQVRSEIELVQLLMTTLSTPWQTCWTGGWRRVAVPFFALIRIQILVSSAISYTWDAFPQAVFAGSYVS